MNQLPAQVPGAGPGAQPQQTQQGGVGGLQQQNQGGAPGSRPAPRPDDSGRQVVAKSRDLLPAVRDKWGQAMREGGQALHQGGFQQNKFEASLEDFHWTLDQMEINLKCALETTSQSQSSTKYMLPNLSYHQYVATAKQQVAFTNQIKDMLKSASQDIVDHSV